MKKWSYIVSDWKSHTKKKWTLATSVFHLKTRKALGERRPPPSSSFAGAYVTIFLEEGWSAVLCSIPMAKCLSATV